VAIQGFLKPRLARLGKIRLGKRAISAKSGNEYPSDLPHFGVPEEVADVYGDAPTELDVMVPSCDFDEFCPIELQRWGTDERKLCHSKDGETALRWSDAVGGWEEIPCAYQDCPYYGKAKGQGCDERGNLFLILPRVSLGGVYQIDTGSRNGLNNVANEFATFQTILRNLTGSSDMIRGVVFRLTRELETLHYVENGARKPVEKYILHLRAPNLSMERAQELAAAYRGNAQVPMLGTGETIPLPPLPSDDDRMLPQLPAPAAMPEPVEECPTDLVPGATPLGPDLGQKAAWAALIEQVKALGKTTQQVEVAARSAIRSVARDAETFDDLAGDTEASAAIDALANMIQHWQEQAKEKQSQPEPESKQPAATDAPAENLSF